MKRSRKGLHLHHVRPRRAIEMPGFQPVIHDEANRLVHRLFLHFAGSHQHVPHQLRACMRLACAQRRFAHRRDVALRFASQLFDEMGHSRPHPSLASDVVNRS
jgi:hypothetical protein